VARFKKLVARRILAVLALSAFGSDLVPARAETRPDPEIEAGIRQVQEGDFETAVVTLEGAYRRLSREAPRSPILVRAALHLGIAYVALEQRETAKARFKDALALDPGLRLTTDRYSPKVIGVFEEARRERAKAVPPPTIRKRSPVPWVVGGVAVAGGTALLATRGGGGTVGATTFSGARFGTPVLDCADGDTSTPLPVSILVEARNDAKQAVLIRSVTATLVIVTSAIPSEIGFASNRPATPMPASLPAGSATTVRVDTSLLCQNGAGDAPRFNEWTGRLTLTTPGGVFGVETTDRMRVNIP
jgi:hypothetical protein